MRKVKIQFLTDRQTDNNIVLVFDTLFYRESQLLGCKSLYDWLFYYIRLCMKPVKHCSQNST